MQVPWFAKIGAKILLARLPITHAGWRRLGLFSHGAMLDPAYALGVFARHRAQANAIRAIPPSFVGLEIGPGDSLHSALVAAAHGAKLIHLVDNGNFADRSMRAYCTMINYLRTRGFFHEVAEFRDIETIEARFGIDYRTRGVTSLQEIPTSSVDFVWSNAALEHVRLLEFRETCYQMRRIMRDSAVASHRVDLRDHLGGGLNNLRFTERTWESPLMANSGFYTNRIRSQQMLDIFEEAGFRVAQVVKETWDCLPIERAHLAEEFLRFKDEELKVSGFDVVLVPK